MCTTKAVDKRVVLIGVLLTLAGGEGQGAMLFLVMEGWFAQLGLLRCKPIFERWGQETLSKRRQLILL